ncbi:hypothetical protein Rmet_6459 [Cupriavidus metallidurans CH34]|uniref:Uncharacterized protein n=1 Tax=Cupriavidus metallidurans (strain ATCC 43123 / DSM 2839 / NBRC 102507 / CH34) TaxID=266264 RepID=D3DXQ4_CUPMC|nr:hypothetical protein Rmet_6459 [Cupriavidus metallidurans CH34]
MPPLRPEIGEIAADGAHNTLQSGAMKMGGKWCRSVMADFTIELMNFIPETIASNRCD